MTWRPGYASVVVSMRSLVLLPCLFVLVLGCDNNREAPPDATPVQPTAPVAAPVVPAMPDAPVVPAAPAAWIEFSSTELGFRAEFPAAPKSEVMKVPTVAGELSMQVFVVDQGSRAFMISVADELPFKGEFVVARVLDGARDGAVSNIHGKLIREQQIEHDKLPARRLEIEAGTPEAPLRVEALLILRGRRLYQAVAVAPAGPGGPEADRFFGALHVL